MGGSASSHLEALLNTAADSAASPPPPPPSAPSPDGVDRRSTGSGKLLDASLPLTLVGFSKGAIVLNQLVTELAGEALETHCFGTHQCSGTGQRVADNGRPGRSSRKRRRAAFERRCSGCGTSAALSGRAFGRTRRKGKAKEAQKRSGAVFDLPWFREDDERSSEGEERPKKEARARRGLKKDSHQVRGSRKEESKQHLVVGRVLEEIPDVSLCSRPSPVWCRTFRLVRDIAGARAEDYQIHCRR